MKRGIGLVLLLIAVGIGVAYVYLGPGDSGGRPGPTGAVETVHIRYGSEKKGFLDDPDVQEILRESYGVVVDGTKMGSLEMSAGSIEGIDALWPSSDLAALLFSKRHPGASFKQHNVFSTPIVFYSWPQITEALIDTGVVQQRQGVYYVIDLQGYLKMMTAKTTWKSIGLNYQTGTVTIRCTDPSKSNSGFLLSGLLAVVLNGNEMVDAESLDRDLPALVEIFKRMGYMENSSGILFDKYIKQGQGAFPLISNYESLIVEFYRAHPANQETIRNTIRVLIPEPTVWSAHPIIALTPRGQKLMQALQDENIQQLAWERYGFRSGAMGIGMDTSVLEVLGLPGQIQAVTPMPSSEVMDQILAALQ